MWLMDITSPSQSKSSAGPGTFINPLSELLPVENLDFDGMELSMLDKWS